MQHATNLNSQSLYSTLRQPRPYLNDMRTVGWLDYRTPSTVTDDAGREIASEDVDRAVLALLNWHIPGYMTVRPSGRVIALRDMVREAQDVDLGGKLAQLRAQFGTIFPTAGEELDGERLAVHAAQVQAAFDRKVRSIA